LATVREFLDGGGFDWQSGIIVWQKADGYAPGWGAPISAEAIDKDHPILDQEFDAGYGSPTCPRFVAKDKDAIYFPDQYDGATSSVKVWLDISRYLDIKEETPYPGGG